MTDYNDRDHGCDVADILKDIGRGGMLDLGPGERLWRLYCFRAVNNSAGLRHRIYTKRKSDGRLALITFAEQDSKAPDDATGASRRVRSNLARVPDLSPGDLERLIDAVSAQATSQGCEIIDLSDQETLTEQLAWLEQQID